MHDVIVIGCGPGGYAAAIRASQLGGKVAIVEDSDVGGTCVNRGCIPSKVWLRAATMLRMISQAEEFGVRASVDGIDFKSIIERKKGVVAEIRMGMEALLEASGIELIRGYGVVKSDHEVTVDENTVAAKSIILATGSSPTLPDDIDGIKDAILSVDQIFEMNQVPGSVLVWGEAGSIDVEMASLLSMLGSKVYLATHHPRILPREDHDTSQRLAQALREQGIQIIIRSMFQSIKKSHKKFKISMSGRQDQTVEVHNLVISARKPNVKGLGLRQIGVRLRQDGSVWINEKLQTSVAGIYALGDITGGWMTSNAASAMAVTAAENAMGQSNDFPFHLVPRGLWTSPQVGAVGLTEEEAEKRGFEIEVGHFPYAVNGLAVSYSEVEGAVKIVMAAETNEILGIHIVGSNATELIGEAVLALQLECTADELAHTIRVHPTFSECLMDAGREASGWALYLPPNR